MELHTRLVALVATALSAVLVLQSDSLTAQDQRDTVSASDSVMQLDPILVRVLRAPAGHGSPYSVAIAAGLELTRAHAGANLEESVRALPGVQIQNRFNMAVGERLSVRGHGARAQFGVRGVRVLVDGIPATMPDGQSTLDHLDLGGLTRVETLRGPAASLYGNAAGGVMHLRTLDTTSPLGPATRVRASAGSHGLLSLRGEVAGGGTGSAYRAAYSHLEYSGFRSDPVANDGSVYGGGRRSVLNFAWHAPLAGGTLRMVANGVDLSALNPGSLSESLLDEGDRQAYRFNVVSKTGKDLLQAHGGLGWSGWVASFVADVATWGVWRDVDNPIPGRIIDLERGAGGVRSLTTREIDTGLGVLTIGAGLEYQIQLDNRENFGNDGGVKTELRLDQRERVQGTATYGQLRLDGAGGSFSTLLGLRYDRIAFKADDHFLADGWDDSGSRVMSAVSPSFGLVARTGKLELFGSIARSFETPTTSELANRVDGAGGINPELDPQRGLTTEGGARAQTGRASLEAVLFRSTLSDQLVPFEVPSEPGRTYYRNAGNSTHSGLELSMRALLSDALTLRFAYTRVNARFDDYTPDGSDYSGNRVPGLAPNRLDAVLSASRSAFFGELRGLYQGELPVDDAAQFTSPAFLVADLRMGLVDLGGGRSKFSPFVSITNLLDRRYNSSVVVNAFGGRYFEPGPGRAFSFGMEISLGGPAAAGR